MLPKFFSANSYRFCRLVKHCYLILLPLLSKGLKYNLDFDLDFVYLVLLLEMSGKIIFFARSWFKG